MNKLNDLMHLVMELNEAARIAVELQEIKGEYKDNPSWETMMDKAMARLTAAQRQYQLWQSGQSS